MDLNSRPNSVSSNSLETNAWNQSWSGNQSHFYHNFSPNMTSQVLYNHMTPNPNPNPNPNPVTNPLSTSYSPLMAGTQPVVGQQFWGQNSDYLSQYYSQYYREYYRRYVQQQHEIRQQQQQQHFGSSSVAAHVRREPLKYGSRSCHSRAIFSQHNNWLIVLDNSSTTSTTTTATTRQLFVYSLNDLLIDYLFPKQFFHLLLRNDSNNQLPFRARELCLEWIRCKEQLTNGEEEVNFELKLILKVIQTLLKQNSSITGLDLSELLFELCSFEELSRGLSQMSNEFLDHFRLLLLRGQKRVALNYALKVGLNDHALALSYLMQTADQKHENYNNGNNDLMLGTIRKFVQNSLLPSDPLTVLYTCLVNQMQRKTVLMELSFESFLILLSNEMDLNQIEVKESAQNTFRHLLSLVKSLMRERDDREEECLEFVLSEELFQNEMDCLLVNECLEFSRFQGSRYNRKLIDRKLKFLSVLFDFGFVSTARDYCRQLNTFSDLAPNERTNVVLKRVVFELESRFEKSTSLQFNHVFSELHIKEDDIDDTSRPNEEHSYDDSRQQTEVVEQNNTQTTSEDNNSVVQNENSDSVLKPALPLVQNNAFDYFDIMSPPMNGQELSASYDVSAGLPSIPMTNGFESNGDALAFISTSNNSMPFEVSDDYVTQEEEENQSERRKDNTEMYSKEKSDEKRNNNTNNGGGGQGGTQGGLFSKLFNFRPKNQAILPDDTNKTIVWDDVSKRYVDKSEQHSAHVTTAPTAPPMGPPPPLGGAIGGGGGPGSGVGGVKKFDIRSQKRYVNVWNNK